MSPKFSKYIFVYPLITALLLFAAHCARLGEAQVSFSEQNMVPAQLITAGTNKPGMGASGGPTTWSFWVKNRQATSDAMLGSFTPFYKVNATRLAVSTHFVLYRDSLEITITPIQAASILSTMENAYDNLKSVYGSGEHPYPNDGARIVILAYNILDDYSTTQNYVGGYFSPRDLFSNAFTTALFNDPVAIQQYSNLIGLLGGYSNEMAIINYDLNPGYTTNPSQVNDIVIHELSHLFTYNRRVIKQRLTNHDLWIAEGIAENAPDQTQGALPANTHAVQQLRLTQLASPSIIDYYQEAPQLTDFLTWAPKIVGYLQSNLFFNYMRHRAEMVQTGSSATMMSELMTTNDHTIGGVEAITGKFIPGANFASIYGDFVITHYLMMLGYASDNANAPTINGTAVNDKYSMNLVKIGDSKATIGTSFLSKYSSTIPFNFEGPKCPDGSVGLKPNSYVIIRHRYPSTTLSPFNGDIDTVNTAGAGAVSGELPLKYVVNRVTENSLISGSPPSFVSLATFDAGQTLPLTTYGWSANDTAHIIIYNPNKTGSCRPFDGALILKRNHTKWVGAMTCGAYSYVTNPSPDFDWQSDSGACWANNQNGSYNRPGGIATYLGGTPVQTPSYTTSNFLYVLDYNNMSLQRLDLDKGTPLGRLGNTSASCPTTGTPWDTGTNRYLNGYCAHNFDAPQGVYVDSGHTIYVADSNNRRIVKYDSTGTFTGWLGLNSTCAPGPGAWQLAGNVTDGETLRLAGAEVDPCMFRLPWGITSDGADLFIVDNGNHRILRRNKTSGNFISYVGNGQNAWQSSTAPITGTLQGYAAGELNSPRGITIALSNFYVADELNHRIVRINAAGNFTGWIGGGSDGWKTTWTGPAALDSGPRSFKNPSAVAADATYLYIADRRNNRISRWNIGTGNFAGWLGHGKVAWDMTASAPDADPYQGVSYYPADYYAEPHALSYASAVIKGTKRNYLFVTSVYNGRVMRINLDCANAPTSSACDQLYDPLTP